MLVALTPVLPVVFLMTLLAWLVVRRPIVHPDRIDTDLNLFGNRPGGIATKMLPVSVRPLMSAVR